ncbi:DUF4345 family protein [Spongiibacter sp. KMU-158]|uniref:DUF4345 family protein n=1 Tax=Spongiibacter pelagi TaxID=2760804 RepID=A0A927BXK3_9GAMM|nr:DUF4345 family protein [Spongiibacter pelagi]MBD2857399.1 DUF4345 family protein [Spongiibacter pelagi]
MWHSIFLGLSALAWAGYGIYCFISPEVLNDMGVITAVSATGTVELRAMYGGVQTALGVLAAAGLVNAAMQRPALIALAFATGGLFSARLLGALLASDFSGYTAGALVFEFLATAVAVILLRKPA